MRARPVIYLSATGACAGFSILKVREVKLAWFLFYWFPFFGPALLFAFAHPRYVFDSEAGKRRRVSVIVLNSLSLVAMLIAFDRTPIYSPTPVAYFGSAPFLITFAPSKSGGQRPWSYTWGRKAAVIITRVF